MTCTHDLVTVLILYTIIIAHLICMGELLQQIKIIKMDDQGNVMPISIKKHNESNYMFSGMKFYQNIDFIFPNLIICLNSRMQFHKFIIFIRNQSCFVLQ